MNIFCDNWQIPSLYFKEQPTSKWAKLVLLMVKAKKICSAFAFKQNKENILLHVQPFKKLNNKICLADFREKGKIF